MTTGVESFGDGTLHQMGAIYPFVGTEGLLVIVGVILWIGWHVWELKNEGREYEVEKVGLKDKAHNVEVFKWDLSKKF